MSDVYLFKTLPRVRGEPCLAAGKDNPEMPVTMGRMYQSKTEDSKQARRAVCNSKNGTALPGAPVKKNTENRQFEKSRV